MAALNDKFPTLLDVARRLDPDGKIAIIAEILNEEAPMLEDCVFKEGNLPTGHKSTVRVGLPTPTWRKLYQGVQPTKSQTAQVTDSCGMLEAYAEVDKALADLNGNTPEFRLSESRAHIEGMAQELSSTMVYGNETTNDAAFTGFAPRYNSLSAKNGEMIVDAGGTDAAGSTSIWLVTWGEQTAHGIYPKGSQAGLQMSDKGQVTIENVDGNGGRMEGYRTHFRQDAGLVLRDWRGVGRICNIDVSALLTDGTLQNRIDAQKLLIRFMVMLSERVHTNKGRACWYVNRTIRENLRLGIVEKIANNLTWETVEGKRVMTFDDIPVKRLDALLNNEGRVVA
jgi:hypothetical protein